MTYSRRFFSERQTPPVTPPDPRQVYALDGTPGTPDTVPALVVTAPDVGDSWLVGFTVYREVESAPTSAAPVESTRDGS